jgi:hypothetical protein
MNHHTMLFVRSSVWLLLCTLPWSVAIAQADQKKATPSKTEPVTINQQDTGYRGIWYYNQKLDNEYVYKYSGGMGTYCAKHQPFAVYRPEVEKTFFCYGGTKPDSDTRLIHLVSYFDHKTGTVPRPTILLDKRTSDAHDNPVLSIDDEGYLWIFSTSHGRSRPSYLHRSSKPYSIDAFEQVDASYATDKGRAPLTNFSYMQAWHVEQQGFMCFFTRYGDPAKRTDMFMTSPDGVEWSAWQRLAAIEEGHYQISCASRNKAAATFNMHPQGKGLNWRTNLYYMETSDAGKTWQAADGTPMELPVTESNNPALIRDYRSDATNVYLKDIGLDPDGRPVILFITSRGYESGPENDPRTWTTAHWTGADGWQFRDLTTSDNNYDMGSLYIESRDAWRVIGPTAKGPQPYNPGGEMAMWLTRDQGRTWKMVKQLTHDSVQNHTYARRPVDAHRDFYAIWADGHGRQPSASSLYFCDIEGNVFQLPRTMEGETARPTPVDGPEADEARSSREGAAIVVSE